jgi:hypothetical protein
MHPYAPAPQQFRRSAQVGQVVTTTPAVISPTRTLLTSLVTLGVLGSAAYVGIKTGMDNRKNRGLQAMGYVGGIGAGVLALASLSSLFGAPSLTGPLLYPFNLPVVA